MFENDWVRRLDMISVGWTTVGWNDSEIYRTKPEELTVCPRASPPPTSRMISHEKFSTSFLSKILVPTNILNGIIPAIATSPREDLGKKKEEKKKNFSVKERKK